MKDPFSSRASCSYTKFSAIFLQLSVFSELRLHATESSVRALEVHNQRGRTRRTCQRAERRRGILFSGRIAADTSAYSSDIHVSVSTPLILKYLIYNLKRVIRACKLGDQNVHVEVFRETPANYDQNIKTLVFPS